MTGATTIRAWHADCLTLAAYARHLPDVRLARAHLAAAALHRRHLSPLESPVPNKLIQTVQKLTDDASRDLGLSRNFAISFRSHPTEPGKYSGWFIMPGDAYGRDVRDALGERRWRSTVAEAEADAGHALVGALQAAKQLTEGQKVD